MDTGDDISFLNTVDYDGCGFKNALNPISQVFHDFDGSHTICIHLLGCVSRVSTKFNNRSALCTFYVAQVPCSIFGMDVICDLQLTISCKNTRNTLSIPTVWETREDNSMTIRLKSDTPSMIISLARRLPFTLEESVEHELRKLLAADIIESIMASSYISPIVVATKDNSIRLCVDYHRINSFTIPDQYPIPSVDELFSKVRNARVFSKIDLKTAYHQLDLRPDNVPEAFTRILQRLLQPCRNIIVYFNNFLMFGSSKADLAAPKSTLQRHNFIINEEKSLYSVENIKYLGRQPSSEGIKPPSNATQAIQQCPAPSSKAELCSFSAWRDFFVASSTTSLHLLILCTDYYKKMSRFTSMWRN